MNNSQLSAAPPAGSTRLFQMAARWRPTRHFTSAIQASVARDAMANAKNEKLDWKPGASLATLAAGCAGTPVCIAIQTTHIVNAQPEKNSRVNQSIRAETWRFRVGKAKAASAASAGNASSKVRSDDPVSKVATAHTAKNHAGSAMCLLMRRLNNWWRQRHNVHSVNGQAGQVNHNSNSA